jgi:hypothetical protein
MKAESGLYICELDHIVKRSTSCICLYVCRGILFSGRVDIYVHRVHVRDRNIAELYQRPPLQSAEQLVQLFRQWRADQLFFTVHGQKPDLMRV